MIVAIAVAVIGGAVWLSAGNGAPEQSRPRTTSTTTTTTPPSRSSTETATSRPRTTSTTTTTTTLSPPSTSSTTTTLPPTTGPATVVKEAFLTAIQPRANSAVAEALAWMARLDDGAQNLAVSFVNIVRGAGCHVTPSVRAKIESIVWVSLFLGTADEDLTAASWAPVLDASTLVAPALVEAIVRNPSDEEANFDATTFEIRSVCGLNPTATRRARGLVTADSFSVTGSEIVDQWGCPRAPSDAAVTELIAITRDAVTRMLPPGYKEAPDVPGLVEGLVRAAVRICGLRNVEFNFNVDLGGASP